MIVVWDLSGVFKKEVDMLENWLQEYLDKMASLDEQISNRCTWIAELTKEIDNLEKQKVELAWEKSLPIREMIDKEAIRGIQYAEVALNLGLGINSLEETCDGLTAILDLSKTKL